MLVWQYLIPALMALLLLAIAGMRRLNFDEWLILRTGWLIANDVPTDVHFLMPFTWLVGVFGAIGEDKATPILILRICVTATTLATLWWANGQRAAVGTQTGFSFLIALACGAFVSHAIEFRYDFVIIVSWLLCWGLLREPPKTRKLYLIGLLFSLLALHHTKGLFYAASLVVYLVAIARIPRDGLFRFAFGAFAGFAIWAWVLTQSGLLNEQLAIYRQFATLGLDSIRQNPVLALQHRLKEDFLWWLFVLPFSLFGVWRLRAAKHIQSTLWFLLTPVAFVFLHPRPWDYLIAPMVPYFAFLATEGAREFLSDLRGNANKTLALSLAIALLAIGGVRGYTRSIEANNFTDLQVLDLLATYTSDGDRVVDPVGAAFFIQPADRQWYLDTLFRKALDEKRWMEATISLDQATIVIQSYRLDWMPTAFRTALAGGFEQACGWIWLRRGDERITAMKSACPPIVTARLQNYWGAPQR